MARFGRRPTGDPVAPRVVTGTLGDPGDDDRLEVTFRISDRDVQLMAGDREIGSWSLADVSMTSGGSTLWYFEAEGDRLPFVPTRPAALEASALVTHRDAGSGRSRTRWRRGSQRRARPSTRSAPSTASAPDPQASDPRATESPVEPSPEPPPLAEAGAAGTDATRSTAAKEGNSESPKRRPLRARRFANPPGRRAQRTKAPDEASRERLWLRSVDAARRRGWFGLDRLPVDESDRHGPHQHTWDHPAAASSGPAQHVCTICGAIRR